MTFIDYLTDMNVMPGEDEFMKKNSVKKFLVSILAVTTMFGTSVSTSVALNGENTATNGANLLDELTAGETISTKQYAPDEIVTVVVELDGKTTLDVDEYVTKFKNDSIAYSTDESVTAYRADMVSQQDKIKKEISEFAPDTVYKYHYTNLLNGFAAQVEYQYIEKIKKLDGVKSVYMTQTYNYDANWQEEENAEYISLEDYYELTGCDAIDVSKSVKSDAGSASQMGLEAAWEAGYTGAGKVVGVFDSSIRYTHKLFSYMDPEVEKAGEAGLLSNYKTKENLLDVVKANQSTLNLFVEGWGSWFHGFDETGFSEDVQQDILNGDFYYNSKVPFSVDYACGDLDAWDGDSSSHGTHVSGIVAGNGGEGYDEISGVKGAAYDAQIMFFKVFDENDDFGQESDEAVFAALDDAVTLGVNAFNLSLGIPNGFTTMNTYAQAGYQQAYNRAHASGITINISAGNDARDSHPGALVNGYTTLLPNSSAGGFSGSLYAPMTVASAQGIGYSYINNYTETTANAVNANGETVNTIMINDLYSPALGEVLNGTYELVDCGDGSSITQDLTGKVALVKRVYGYVPYDEAGIMAAQENAYKAGAVAVYLTFDYYSDYFGTNGLWTGENGESIPVFAGTPTNSNVYNTLAAAIANGTVNVTFSSEDKSETITRNYNDNGPAGSTSWGVSESMNLKPDVMAPGGNIWSAGASSDTALSSKSGTSMASPNAEGLFILAQQYVDDNLDTFGVKTGTHEYVELINQLVASTAIAYQPFVSSEDLTRQNLYFSPRRQGAGMANIENVINSLVLLRNDTVFDPITGDSPRTKVQLGDKLGTTFDITFNMDNYDSVAKTFDVLACLQTDNTTESDGRTIIAPVNTYGSDIDAIEDGVMKVTAVSNGTIVSESDNINRYSNDASATKISVPANSSTKITVSVTLNEETMKAYDEKYPNGMFLEGFVFFDNVDSDYETLSIPYLGFRGDWNAAPIFDLATAYDDISELDTTDEKYPLFHTTTLNSLVDGYDVVLGANQFTGTSLPDYFGESSTSYYNTIRSYLDDLRTNGELNGSYVTISPNEDGKDDIAYAALYLLRNAKALCVVIKDENGNVVNVIGPEYEYFEAKVNDGNRTQQAALTYGTKYNREMYWDGTDSNGNLVKEGTYTFEVRAIQEYEYLNSVDYGDKDSCLDVLMNSDNVQTQSFNVNVDVTAPEVDLALTNDKVLTINASDTSGIQALAVYYKDARVSDIIRVNNTEADLTINLNDLIENISDDFDVNDLEVQVVDYGMNTAEASATTADKTALQIAIDLANAITDEDLANVVPAVADEFKAARDEANAIYNDLTASQEEVNNTFDRLASAMHMLDFVKGDKTALKAFIDKVSGLEADKYTEATWTPFNDALVTANNVYNDENAMQEEVDATYKELVTAFLNLRLIPDKSLLEDLINKAEGLNLASYSKATVQVVNDALANAKNVLANENATQKDIDNAKATLEKAINSLEANVNTPADNTVSTPVNNGDTTTSTTSIKTGDENLIGMFTSLGLLASLSAIACLKKRKNN